MPQSKAQKFLYALITVVITVCAFVFYSLFVINGSTFLAAASAAGTETTSVLAAIKAIGGIAVLGHQVPVWAVMLIEFALALTCECLVGSPLSEKLAAKHLNFKTASPHAIENAIIKSTVFVMVPLMSFLATILYYPYASGFAVLTFLATWLKTLCLNFPFAYFGQIFFIQPTVRTIFKTLFARKK